MDGFSRPSAVSSSPRTPADLQPLLRMDPQPAVFKTYVELKLSVRLFVLGEDIAKVHFNLTERCSCLGVLAITIQTRHMVYMLPKILYKYVGERSSQDMTARQNAVTPASVLPSGEKKYVVYVTTIQNLCLSWLCHHNLCNVCVSK